jgi:hypothetical protein
VNARTAAAADSALAGLEVRPSCSCIMMEAGQAWLPHVTH